MSKKKLAVIIAVCIIAIVVAIILVLSPLLHAPKLTLTDAPKVLDLSSELPEGFTGHYSSEPVESSLLGIGSGTQHHTRGTVLGIGTGPWNELELVLWVVDDEVAQNTSVEEAFAEFDAAGERVDVGNEADAIKEGDCGSGLELLLIKYQNAYVFIFSWYSHPQDEYVDIIPLSEAIVDRLSEYSY